MLLLQPTLFSIPSLKRESSFSRQFILGRERGRKPSLDDGQLGPNCKRQVAEPGHTEGNPVHLDSLLHSPALSCFIALPHLFAPYLSWKGDSELTFSKKAPRFSSFPFFLDYGKSWMCKVGQIINLSWPVSSAEEQWVYPWFYVFWSFKAQGAKEQKQKSVSLGQPERLSPRIQAYALKRVCASVCVSRLELRPWMSTLLRSDAPFRKSVRRRAPRKPAVLLGGPGGASPAEVPKGCPVLPAFCVESASAASRDAECAAARAPRRLRGDFIMLPARPRAALPPPPPRDRPGPLSHAVSAPRAA